MAACVVWRAGPICLCVRQVNELEAEVERLRAAQATTVAAATRTPATSASDLAKDAALRGAKEQQLVLRQQLVALAADNARLAVALAEANLQQQQQDQSLQSSQPTVLKPASCEDPEQHEQRLQLLVSQLSLVRDQTAAAEALSEQQQSKITQQHRQLLQALQDLNDLQQEHAALLADKQWATATADEAAAAAEGASRRGGSGQDALQLRVENSKLQALLAEALVTVRRLSVECEVLGALQIEQGVVMELDAKNRGLLQV